MAFTSAQLASIRTYLGYPDNFRWADTRLETVMANVSPDAQTLVIGYLADLATIETALLGPGLAAAGAKRVDEIWMENGGSMMREQRKLGRMRVGRISIILGVPIYSDVFGQGGYLGDSFTPSGYPGNGEAGGGGFFRLG